MARRQLNQAGRQQPRRHAQLRRDVRGWTADRLLKPLQRRLGDAGVPVAVGAPVAVRGDDVCL